MKGIKTSLATALLSVSALTPAGAEVVPRQLDLSDVPVLLVDEIAIPIPREIFDVVIYAFLGLFKIVFLVFNAVPYLALLIVG